VSGHPSRPPNVDPGAKLAGKLHAALAGPGGTVVALTSEAVHLVSAGKVVHEVPSKGAVQLAVTSSGVAVTMTPAAVAAAYRVTASVLEPIGEAKAKKAGPLWAKGDRVFFCFVASYFEVTGF
jgi:hypothetical protein